MGKCADRRLIERRGNMENYESVIESLGRVVDKLENMREDLYDINDFLGVDETFYKIVKLEDLDNETREIIVLLYSKFKADAQLLKNDSYKSTSKTVDSLLELTKACKYIAEAISAANDAKSKRAGFFGKIGLVGGVILVILVTSFTLFSRDHIAGQLVVNLFSAIGSTVKSIFGL